MVGAIWCLNLQNRSSFFNALSRGASDKTGLQRCVSCVVDGSSIALPYVFLLKFCVLCCAILIGSGMLINSTVKRSGDEG